MLDAIEKARKVLSSVPETQINIEYLMNEEDLVRNLSRVEFEKVIEPFIGRFKNLIALTLKSSGKFLSYLNVVVGFRFISIQDSLY